MTLTSRQILNCIALIDSADRDHLPPTAAQLVHEAVMALYNLATYIEIEEGNIHEHNR